MDSIKELAKLVARYIKGDEKKTKAYDTSATVKRIANGIAYVQIPGGVSETPVKLTIDAKKGDTVQVRVANGTAWLVGNRTAPPTDDTTANIAKTKATTAEKVATVAEEAAGEAQVKANAAATQAAAAKQIADNTEQHFWFTETGVDTGAHITEVTQEEWNDPLDPNYQSGGNLLARSNGIAVRDGMTELAYIASTGMNFKGKDGQNNLIDYFIVSPNNSMLRSRKAIVNGLVLKYFITPQHDSEGFHIFLDRAAQLGEGLEGVKIGKDECFFRGTYDDNQQHYYGNAIRLSADDGDGIEVGYYDYSGNYTEHTRIEADDGDITTAGTITAEGHTSAIGTIYNGTTTSVNVTSNVDTYVAGSSITLPIGKYIVRAYGSFPTNSTEAIRRVQIWNDTASTELATESNWDRYWVAHNVMRICNVTANNTVLKCRVSAGVAINTVSTQIEAIRIV